MNKLHIGIVLDGNRRFAKRLMKQPWKGHEYGAKKLKKLFSWCKDYNIKEMTLYCLSLENFNRPKREFNYLMKLFEEELRNTKTDSNIHKNKIRIKFMGKTNLLNKELQKLIKQIEEQTKNYKNYTINFAIAYGGREEIVDAVKKIVKEKAAVNEKNIEKNLWIKNNPDLIIRTGGEKRTSNFLPWQSTYSEWIFLDKMWPEFSKNDLKKCMKEYYNRERRYGK